MGIYYYKLFDLLNRRGMKKGDLMTLTGISNATMAKLANNKVVQTDIINRICTALQCQPGDIMEWIADSKPEE
jgi:DNA-binding Xre family transcriptional regulator